MASFSTCQYSLREPLPLGSLAVGTGKFQLHAQKPYLAGADRSWDVEAEKYVVLKLSWDGNGKVEGASGFYEHSTFTMEDPVSNIAGAAVACTLP